MKRKIAILLTICLIVSLFSGCCLKHEWESATCEAPKTCAKCGKTAGETLDHEYVLRGCDAQSDIVYELHICKICSNIDKTVTEDEVALANSLIIGKWNIDDPEGELGGMEAWIEFREDGTGELNHDGRSEKFTWISFVEKYGMSITGTDMGITMIMYAMEDMFSQLAMFCEPDGNNTLHLATGGIVIPFSR